MGFEREIDFQMPSLDSKRVGSPWERLGPGGAGDRVQVVEIWVSIEVGVFARRFKAEGRSNLSHRLPSRGFPAVRPRQAEITVGGKE
jgi:hypothetical protein